MQRIAIIDIGSNSARLVISHIYKNGAFNMVYNQKETLRLAHLVENNKLTPDAFKITKDTMRNFAQMCHLYHVDKTIAVATAAIRNSDNGKELVEQIAKEIGIQLHIISGNTEAYISYLGAINTMDYKDGIIFDLGGGSTELILFKDRKVLNSVSLPFGAVNLTDIFHTRANMIVRLKGKQAKPELMFTGHLDTVPVGTVKWEHDPFAFDIVDGMVYGRGVDDMKGGDAAALYAMIMLKRNGIVPENDLVFVGTVGEETMDLGSGHFTANGGMKDVGALVVCEPSGVALLTAHKGAIWVKVEFFGQTSHGSMPDLGVNALLHMAKFINVIQNQPFDIKPDPKLGMPTLSINMASAGAAANVVPDHAECTIDFRTIPGQTWEDVKAHIDKALAVAAEGEKDFRYQYAYIDKVLSSVACPEGHHILTDFDKAAGRELPRRQVMFFTDASTMVTRPDLPVVIIGPGESSQAHQPNEHIPLEQFYDCINIYYNFMKDYKM